MTSVESRYSEGTLLTNSVRNADGIWINSRVFCEEGKQWEKNKYYILDPKGTASYKEYWDEQLRRCTEGYSVGGVKITEHHYAYLNFSPIDKAKEKGNGVARKELGMPDFWDGDYAYFWAIEIAKNGLFNDIALAPSTKEERFEYQILDAEWRTLNKKILAGIAEENTDVLLKINSDKRFALEEAVLKRLQLPFTIRVDWRNGGKHVIVGKARRKGYSFKNGAICANTYNTIRKSTCIIGAFDKKFLYPEGTMGMVSEYLSFLNEHTAFTKAREFVDKQEHKKASYEKWQDGAKIEAGYQSQVMAISFGDNPDAARGKDPVLVLFEEAGKFPNLRASFKATVPALGAGKYTTGQIIIFGTGGDMESGTVDFADMFYHPEEHNLMPFENQWDNDAEGTSCGFFHPVTWNMEGYYDSQGNSDIYEATLEEKAERHRIQVNSTSSKAMEERVQEAPFNPSEAFLTVSINDFPIIELRARYNKVIRESLHIVHGKPHFLSRGADSKVTATLDLENIIDPIWEYKVKNKDLKGGVVIFEKPEEDSPRGLYKIGFDPYRQASSNDRQPSLAAIYVYKSSAKFSFTRETIVAQYIGRPKDPDDVNRIAELLAEYYNAEIMHENEVTHVKGYFQRRNKLHLLAAQPDAVISANIKESKVARIYGIHMNDKLKDAGEKYIKSWLLQERDIDENGKVILNLDTINDPALLDELILYNRKGNFDRVMAFMMLMFQLQEEEEGKQYDKEQKEHKMKEDLENLLKQQFGGRAA